MTSVSIRRFIPSVPCVLAAFLLAGPTLMPAPAQAQPRSRASLDTTLTLARDGIVEVAVSRGDLTVRAGRDGQVRVLGPEASALDIGGSARALRLGVLDGARSSIGDLTVEVPRGTRLFVQTQSGDVSVTGIDGDAEVRTVSGDVSIREAHSVRVETVSGDLTVRGASRGVTFSTTSGDIMLDDVVGDVDVSGTSATVDARAVRSERVRVKVMSGDIQWTGALEERGRYEFGTHSGTVALRVPGDSRATLDVQTWQGGISTGGLSVTRLPDRDTPRMPPTPPTPRMPPMPPAPPTPPTPPSRAAAEAREMERAVRDRERERERAVERELRVERDRIRDSVRRVVRDSVEQERRERRARGGADTSNWERELERNIERDVGRALEGVMESLVPAIEAAMRLAANSAEAAMTAVERELTASGGRIDGRRSNHAQRFELGGGGGPLVSISTFSGNIILDVASSANRR